ncbi:WG repeat-containing protein [Fusibacter ferrireducens]|uniref:WG repeat-containing protein n=1 Tax=Fusibacter ferrireducens TaxID=2785058 RepID=A0ABR9ZZ71_9FIRM|nr:WG repeat-containing protein [Fusibacter ferrireducens]MBF4695752.1 WG repeat-containing protein [Fusibacter ferrireducens]
MNHRKIRISFAIVVFCSLALLVLYVFAHQEPVSENSISKEAISKEATSNPELEETEVPLTSYSRIEPFSSDGMAAVEKDGLWGFIGTGGTLEILPQYTKVTGFTNGYAIVHTQDGTQIIDTYGNEILDKPFIGEIFNNDNYYAAVKNGQYQIVDINAGKINAPAFDRISPFGQNLFVVKVNEKYGLVDMNGKEICPVEYDEIASNSYRKDALWGILGDHGEIISDPFSDSPFEFVNGVSSFLDQNHLFGYVTKAGILKIPSKFNEARFFNEDRAVVSVNNDFFLIDRDGQKIGDTFEYIGFESENRYPAVSKTNHLWGFIDNEGAWLIEPQYAAAIEPFELGLAVIQDTEGISSIIDTGGNALFSKKSFIRKITYSDVDIREPFTLSDRAFFIVQDDKKIDLVCIKDNKVLYEIEAIDALQILKDEKTIVFSRDHRNYYYDLEGQTKFEFTQFDEVSPHISNHRLAVKSDGKWGFINTDSGELVIECIYRSVEDFINGYATVRLDNQYDNVNAIDTEGHLIIK